jgi:hypothetical protein
MGAPYIYDISRLRVNIKIRPTFKLNTLYYRDGVCLPRGRL